MTEVNASRIGEEGAEIVRAEGLAVELPTGISTSVQAVRDVALVVRKGERVGVVGESGSGKSVTGRAIAGLLPESRRVRVGGSLKIYGKEMIGAPAEDWLDIRRRVVSMIFQDPQSYLNPTMQVGRQVAEACRKDAADAGQSRRDAALEYMRLAGLPAPETTARRYPFQLSGGMRQRVLIAIALAKRPDLIIADEPTTALDVTVQAKVLESLDMSVRTLGSSLIMISHDLGVVAKLCDRIYVMYRGEVVEAGPTMEVFQNPAHDYTRQLLSGIRRLTSDEALHDAPAAPAGR